MPDWSKYIERPYVEVLEELKVEGYQVVDDDLFAGYRNTELQKDDIKIQLASAPIDMDDFEEKAKSEDEFGLDAVEWYVEGIHFEWFPLGIDKITGKKKKDYTLCFHVETRKEIWCKFERLFDSTTFEKSKTRKQTLEYNKTISFERSISDMLNDDNDEGLKEFIEKAYSGITPDLIHKINEQIKKMKKA